jgi:hypothetical protein
MRPRTITKLAWLIATPFLGTACHTMRPITLDEVEALHPREVQVTHAGRAFVVEGPKLIVGNRLAGFVDGEYQALPASDVTQVLMRVPAPGRTVALIAGTTLGALAVAYLLAGNGSSDSSCDPNVGDGGCVPGN